MAFRVLVVDDASFVRETIKRSLRQLIPDAEIIEAADGKKAISALKVNAIDLILSDWEMPELSGEEFLKWVRAQPRFFDTPFLMVTSRGDRDHVVTAVSAGVTDYLTKPFTAEELSRKIGKQLNRIGYVPTRKASSAPEAGGAFSSLSVLTGGDAKPSAKQKPQTITEAPGFGKPKKAAPQKPKFTSNFQGSAQIRLAKSACDCQIRELSLQAMNGVITRSDAVPVVFEQAVVDLENEKGEPLARLNGYVHSVVASDPKPDAESLKVTIRFVDNDPEKFEVLSKAIAGK